MADFLNEFVKTVMDDNIRENYPHVRHPALLTAEVKETMTLGDQPFVTLQILTEKGGGGRNISADPLCEDRSQPPGR